MMFRKIVLLCLLLAISAFSVPWATSLYIDGGGQWNFRVPVFFENPTDADFVGRSVPVVIPEDCPLIGQRAGTIRIVDDIGRQLKFAVENANGILTDDAAIAPNFKLHVPLSCLAHDKATYYIYYGNDKAWTSPDQLANVSISNLNGSFEIMDGNLPAGWSTALADEQHVVSVSTQNPASGKNCLLLETVGDAEPSWFQCSPRNISLTPGAKCSISVKIRAENAQGRIGWFIHVGNQANSMMINRVEHLAEGTYGWKQLTFDFTVPPNADSLRTGPVLFGSGKVWFDDFTFTTDAKTVFKSYFGATESILLKEIGRLSPNRWPAPQPARFKFGFKDKQPKYLYRVPLRISNPTDDALENVVAVADLSNLLRNKSRKNSVLTFNGKIVNATSLGSNLLFKISCPPKTTQVYYIYTTDKLPEENQVSHAQSTLGSDILSDQVFIEAPKAELAAQYADLLDGNSNLVRNPSFEKQQDNMPLDWTCAGEKLEHSDLTFGIGRPGCHGGCHAYFNVPPEAPQDWVGWRQTVSVLPNRRYLYGAWVATENTDTSIAVHCHMLDADQKVISYLSTPAAQKNERKWQPLFGSCVTSADATALQIHLTMNGHGTLRHDGVIVMEAIDAVTEPLEARNLPQTDIALWQVNSVVKTFREDLPPYFGNQNADYGEVRYEGNSHHLNKFFQIMLAKNEEEPLQIAIRSGRKIDKCRVFLDDLDKAGISASVGVVGYVPIDNKSSYYGSKEEDWVQLVPSKNGNTDGWAGWWPDPIIPVNQFSLPANQTQPIWISLKTTPGAKPGEYRFYVNIDCDGQIVYAPVHLTIWNFSLPQDTEFPAVYDYRSGSRWKRPNMTPTERDHELYKFYKEKKICPDHINASPIFKRNPESGEITADFTEFDKEADFYFNVMKFPVAYTPGIFYLFGWAFPPHNILGEKPFEGEAPWANDEPRDTLRPEYKKAYQTCLRLFMDHCRQKGWDDKFVLYISDEPHYSHKYVTDQMKACCAMIKEVEPNLPIYSSTWSHCKDWDGYISLWGAGHYGIFPEAEIKDRIRQGDRFWFTTDGQMCTDTPACAIERLLPHYCSKYGVGAYEFWGATWLTYDPWKYGWHAYIKQTSAPHITPSWTRYPAGDGYLIYPGIPESDYRPVTSIRLEAARDGVDDYEYLQMVKRLLRANDSKRALMARELINEAEDLISMPSAGGRFSSQILPNPNKLQVLRFRIGEFLSK